MPIYIYIYICRIEYTKEVAPRQFLVNLLPLVLLVRVRKGKSTKGDTKKE